MFDAPRGDLFVRRRKDGFLHLAYFVLHRFATAEQIQACPREQARDGIQVRAKGFAADTGGFKRNGTAAAKAIADARRVAEGALAKLLDQFRQRFCFGAKMGVDLRPRGS